MRDTATEFISLSHGSIWVMIRTTMSRVNYEEFAKYSTSSCNKWAKLTHFTPCRYLTDLPLRILELGYSITPP